MNQKRNDGITLIALVITIIVLLILAGVTINMVLGDEGIIKKAQQADKVYTENSEAEVIGQIWTGRYISEKYVTSTDKGFEDELKEAFSKNVAEGDIKVEGSIDKGFKVTIGENEYNVSTDGKVTKEDKIESDDTGEEVWDNTKDGTVAKELKVGDYVEYKYNDVNEVEQSVICAVLYNNAEKGCQITFVQSEKYPQITMGTEEAR